MSNGTLLYYLLLGSLLIAASMVLFFGLNFGHPLDEPLKSRLMNKLCQVDPRLCNIRLYKGNSSYTKNKSQVFLCTHDPKTGMQYGDNVLMYVLLHEAAHLVTPGYGHGHDFQESFNRLLKKGAMMGVYDPSSPIPKDYCGTG